jgi:hypothetical protein
MLAVSQMLLYFAEWPDKSDTMVKSSEAKRVLASLNSPQMASAVRRYPEAGMSVIIRESCEKVVQGHPVILAE